jgi:hypothetical protein
MNVPLIARLWDGSVRLTFPFDRWLVDALKGEVPVYARTYDPDTRAWTITAAYAHVASRLMHDVFPDVEIVGAATPPPFDHSRPSRDDPWVTLHLRPTAPPELVSAAHKCLAKLNHPDAGGSTALMQRINAAADRIREAS